MRNSSDMTYLSSVHVLPLLSVLYYWISNFVSNFSVQHKILVYSPFTFSDFNSSRFLVLTLHNFIERCIYYFSGNYNRPVILTRSMVSEVTDFFSLVQQRFILVNSFSCRMVYYLWSFFLLKNLCLYLNISLLRDSFFYTGFCGTLVPQTP